MYKIDYENGQEKLIYPIYFVSNMKNKPFLVEVWDFLRVRKIWWLTPIIIMLLLVAILIIVGQSSSVSPFVYALF